MPSKRPNHPRTPKAAHPTPELDLSDEEFIAELVAEGSERDLAAVLHEFPRDPQFVLAIYERFLAHDSAWSPALRTQLADALARCRLHEEADVVRDS